MTTPGRWLARHVEAWTERSFVRWLCLCDICKKRRLVARYHEVYTDDKTWRYGCRTCVDEVRVEQLQASIEELQATAEQQQARLEKIKQHGWFCSARSKENEEGV